MKIRTTLNIWLTISVFLLAMGTTAAGEVIYVDDDAMGSNNGSSWADAYNDLQDALTAASSGDEIWVAAGTYKPDPTGLADPREATFQIINGVAIYGGFAGGETSRNQRDTVTNVTILSGDLNGDDGLDFANNAENSYHVVTGSGTDETAILDGFTITAGNADEQWPHYSGGGMYTWGGSPTLTNCTFSGNSANSSGGGMYDGESNPTLTNCTFRDNSASGWGGGMYNWRNSSPTLTNCTFSGNSAGYGGGMRNDSSSPTLTNCTFSSNSAFASGGMHNSSSSPTVTNCTFSGNTAAVHGGGMYNVSSSPMLTNCTFSGNSAVDSGGGMFNDDSSSPTLMNCTFNGNSAFAGGGMYNNSSSPTLTNCIFSGNSSNLLGGGMYNYAGNPTLTNCAFSGNSANSGGGMYNTSSSPTLTNCILWDNTAAQGPQISLYNNSTLSISYCDLQGGLGAIYNDNSTINGGSGNIDADPLFEDADGPDNVVGTEDDNLRLSAGSPCIDAGDNSAVPGGVTTDLDGNPRFINGIVDMGAYEYRLVSDIAIQKCKVRAGKMAGRDSINFSGQLDVTADAIANADRIYVAIFSDADNYLVYSEPIDLDLFRAKKGKYTYKEKIPKGEDGAITLLKLNTNKQKFQLQAKNIDLTGLGCPLSLGIQVGDYYWQGQADEAIVNGKKAIPKQFIPMQLMSGYADTLRVDKVRIKLGKKKPSSDSLSVKGAFALKNDPASIGNVVVTLGSQVFTIPGDKFISKGNAEICKKVDIGNGIVNAKFDPVKCTFIVTIKKTNIDSTSGTVDFGISAFGSFEEFVEVNLD